ncbi:MAG: aminoglycoside phosphotransferase family protein, partial [Actinomycetota bacterium]|nr:aminoglycoside phosphotransferase family protein [Actinomycetota bacterium]
GRRPLKAVARVRIPSGLHPESFHLRILIPSLTGQLPQVERAATDQLVWVARCRDEWLTGKMDLVSSDADEQSRTILTALLGQPILACATISSGFTAAQVYRISLAGGHSAVAKVAPWSAEREQVLAGLRIEALVLSTLTAPFLPRLLAADDTVGALVIEDLGTTGWLPHGTDGQWPIPPQAAAESIWRTAEAIRTLPIPAGLPSGHSGLSTVWERVGELDLGPMGIDQTWWQQAAPLLRQAAAQHELAVSVLVHGDFKGANLCLRDGYVVAVDWSGAHHGDPSTDVLEAAIWLRMAGARVLPPGLEMLPLLSVYGGLLVQEYLTLHWQADEQGQRARELKRRTALEALSGFSELIGVASPSA